jgi:hypothetical protein
VEAPLAWSGLSRSDGPPRVPIPPAPFPSMRPSAEHSQSFPGRGGLAASSHHLPRTCAQARTSGLPVAPPHRLMTPVTSRTIPAGVSALERPSVDFHVEGGDRGDGRRRRRRSAGGGRGERGRSAGEPVHAQRARQEDQGDQRGRAADQAPSPLAAPPDRRVRSWGAAVAGGLLGRPLESRLQVAHGRSSTSSASPSLAASARRPRDSRLFTVPAGARSVWATSSTGRPTR